MKRIAVEGSVSGMLHVYSCNGDVFYFIFVYALFIARTVFFPQQFISLNDNTYYLGPK